MTASFRSRKIVHDFEAETFLQSYCGGLETLNNFPNVKQLFLKSKTPLPSSAAVERFFSAGGLVYRPNRNRLSDTIFERLLFLKCN